jgi:hypothetical protein
VQVLPSPPLVPTSMSEGGEIHDNSLAMAGPGSTPVSAPSASVIPPETLPLPVMPPAQAPVNPQAGRYGAAGLQHEGARAPEGDGDAAPWPSGNQGLKDPLSPWKKTPSFGPPGWGPQASNT